MRKLKKKKNCSPRLEAHGEVLLEVELGGRTSQQHREAQLEPQFVPHVLEALPGQHGQLQRGDSNQQHVAPAPGALSARGVDQVLHHGQGLRGYVVSQGRRGGQGHHGLGVLLNQQVAADHHAVKVRMSGENKRTSLSCVVAGGDAFSQQLDGFAFPNALEDPKKTVGDGALICVSGDSGDYAALTSPATCGPSSQRRHHSAEWGWPRPTAGSCCSPAGRSRATRWGTAPPAGRQLV